jgi:hypothetical protein
LAQRRVILFFWPTRIDDPDLYGVGSDALLATEFFQAHGKTS